jgi:V/A-type H+-transporting ATPase subunit E
MTDKVHDLETAILNQAQQLANQLHEEAERSREEILREGRKRLHEREEREVLLAKSVADRRYRRQVLSEELSMQAKLDRLRWGLVQSTQQRLREELQQLADADDRYLPLLRDLIVAAVANFDQPDLVVEANARDHARLTGVWDDIRRASGKKLTMTETPLECIGGVIVRTPDNRERVDQTFEGRMHRLAGELHRAIQENLFPNGGQSHNTILS